MVLNSFPPWSKGVFSITMSKDWFGQNWSNRAHFLNLLQIDLDFITLQVCLLNMNVVQNGYFMSSNAYVFRHCPPALQIYSFISINGLFKVNLEFRISGETWKMIYQFLLETGNWKLGFWNPPWFLVAEQNCNN